MQAWIENRFYYQWTIPKKDALILAKADDPLPENLRQFAPILARRSMIVKKAKPLAIECIVRGYLSGSGWKEYKKS